MGFFGCLLITVSITIERSFLVCTAKDWRHKGGFTTIGRKPQLANVTISRNHDWPKAQIGQKQAGGPPLSRARYGPPARFQPISSIFWKVTSGINPDSSY
jgi:hypothetical protein